MIVAAKTRGQEREERTLKVIEGLLSIAVIPSPFVNSDRVVFLR